MRVTTNNSKRTRPTMMAATKYCQKMAGVSLGCLATKAARTRLMPEPSSVT